MTPDGQYHCDEFIGEVISIGRLTRLHIDLPVDRARVGDWMGMPADGVGSIVLAELIDPNDNNFYEFRGEGKTMGFALYEARERIREHFGR